MKAKNINWQQHPDFPDNYQGLVGEQEVVTIVNIGKKDQLFELKSWPLKSNTFYNSSSSKKLGEFSTLKLAQYEAQIKWEEFFNSILEIDVTNTEHVS